MRSSSLCRYRSYLFVSLLLGLCLFGCDEKEDNTVGPCIHQYQDPILTIEEVRDAQTNESLESVVLTEFSIDGAAIQTEMLVAEFANNVEQKGDSLLCTIPCAFGTQAGHYEFIVLTSGYVAKAVSFDLEYEEFEGGCPSYNRGGAEEEIALEPR